MSIAEPQAPADPAYPTDGPHLASVEKAHALFKEELASTEGWQDQGEREGVQLYSKPDPDNAYAVPTVKGECTVSGVTTDQFLAVIQLPGMRRRWDSRFDGAHMLRRYTKDSYAFYSVMKGMGWLVYPRDICGMQKNYRSTEPNQEIVIIQTSIEEEELAPEQSGKARATLAVSGWQLLPEGDDIKVTYIVNISLNGSIPFALVSMISTEIPLCTGHARDVYERLGHAPYVRAEPTNPTIFQNETFSNPVSATDDGELAYTCSFVPKKGGDFEVVYDHVKMYKDGVQVTGAEGGVKVEDDGKGTIKVTVEGDGELVTLEVRPK